MVRLHRFDAPVCIPDPLSRSLMLPNYEPSNDDVTEERHYSRMSGDRPGLSRANERRRSDRSTLLSRLLVARSRRDLVSDLVSDPFHLGLAKLLDVVTRLFLAACARFYVTLSK